MSYLPATIPIKTNKAGIRPILSLTAQPFAQFRTGKTGQAKTLSWEDQFHDRPLSICHVQQEDLSAQNALKHCVCWLSCSPILNLDAETYNDSPFFKLQLYLYRLNELGELTAITQSYWPEVDYNTPGMSNCIFHRILIAQSLAA